MLCSQERRYYEESFRVYERGIAAFHWPHLNSLWLMYLTKFVSRYRSSKLERARELFQQATANVPKKYAKNIFLLYAKLEENYGLAKHALAIYSAATKAVLPEEKFDMFLVYIARVRLILIRTSFACISLFMHACMHACIYLFINAFIYLSMRLYIYVCTHTCKDIYIYIYICIYMHR